MMGSGGLLLAAAAGYLVLERAAKQKGSVKQIGQAVGVFIIVASVAGVAFQALGCGSKPRGAYGSHHKALECPFTPKAPASHDGAPSGK